MQIILNWLNGNRNFITGRILYNKYGTDADLKKLLITGQTPESAKKLEQGLASLCKPQTVAVQPAKQTLPARPVPAHKPAQAAPTDPAKQVQPQQPVSLQQMPDMAADIILHSIQIEWKEKYARMNLLRHKLDEYGTDNSPKTVAECGLLCQEILDLEQQVNILWDKRDTYLATGKLPEVKEDEFVIPTDPLELAKLINRLERYVRKHRKNLAENPGSSLYAGLLTKYQDQLNLIKNAQTN